WQTLNEVLKQVNTGDPTPPLGMNNGRPQINMGNQFMREQLAQAYRDFVRMSLRTHRKKMAEDFRDTAVNNHGFPAALFDPLFIEPAPPVLPPEPVIYKSPATNGRHCHPERSEGSPNEE